MLRNFVYRDKRVRKIGGTEAYNGTSLGSAGIPWLHRSYHKLGDGSFRKVVFCYHDGYVYYGKDLDGTMTVTNIPALRTDSIPVHFTMQVGGNAMLYLITGGDNDPIYKYDGNGDFKWEETRIINGVGRIVTGGLVHLDRAWYWSRNSSLLAYSRSLFPEDLSSDSEDIPIGQDADSNIVSCIVGGNETLYIFKSNSIWRLSGKYPGNFNFNLVTDRYGLANKRCLVSWGGGIIFLDSLSKEIYFFGGTESSIKSLTEDTIRLREIIDMTQLENACMTIHDGLFRFSYKHKDDNIYQTRELIYSLNDPGPSGVRWSESKGTAIWSYSVWDKLDDNNELVTGRSDIGKIMYHNRTRNFDGVPIETWLRTGSIIGKPGQISRYSDITLQAHPGSTITPINFRYYMDERHRLRGDATVDLSGETRQFGEAKISRQDIVNNRVIPHVAYSRGNGISFEYYDNSLNTFIELYGIQFEATPRYKIRNAISHVH